MKTTIRIFLLFAIALVIVSSCKDEPTPFETPETAMYFNGIVNNYEKAIVDGQNGYEYASSDSCAVLTNGMTWFADAKLYQGNSNYFMSNRECFAISYHNLFDTVLLNRDSVISQYFAGGMPFAYVDSTSGPSTYYYGIEVLWTDGKGDVYTSLYTPQSGNFTFDLFSNNFGGNGRTIKIEGSFACSVYCIDSKKTISITDGKTRMSNFTTCY